MPLFQSSVITKHLQNQNKENIALKWKNFKNHFHNPRVQEEIKSLKEEQYQGEFLEDFFVKILGYTKPASSSEAKFNLTTEYKNIKDSKKADGAIIVNDVVKAVIELKGTNTTDLSKIEVQAFGYKNNQPDCTYIITSNFEKLRFYIDNAIEHLEFNLFTLTQKEFNLLYLCLAYENIEKDIPKKIKDQSISQEDAITKKLYNDYSLFKRELHQNLVVLNPQFDALELFQKSQKLLDRFLFLFFAEDRQLLPPNSVRLILDQWQKLKELDAYTPLFDRFKKYFGYLNTGHKGKQYDVYAYNGGLFLPDEVLDTITIDDDLLYKHTLKLSEYDFISEVDVNILGHIFENSLNELDEIKAQLAGETVDKTKTKRKKDGVFYTPKYITKYIVENTVGKLCVDKRPLAPKGGISPKLPKKEKQQYFEALKDYRSWLLQLSICDPACGSGAFLNQTLDFLINEHKYIDELQAKLFGDAMVLSDVEKSILENNLFGVDLNEESVEIAKLSLWLRTAQPNRKLNDLNNNIKCGNSLIDDVAIAGDKAFNWQQEFPQIFAKGGFDMVIGNPPYVKLETIKGISDDLSKLQYSTFEKRGDLYILFVEKGFQILKENGKISYIMPNKWLQAGYGKPLREFFLTQNLMMLIDFGDLQIFEGATTYPCIFIAEKNQPQNEILISVLSKKNEIDFYNNVLENQQVFKQNTFNGDTWVISSNKDKVLLEKLQNNFKSLSQTIKGEAYYGVKTGLSEAFFIDKSKRNKLIENDKSAENILLPFLKGRDLSKWQKPAVENYLIGTFPSLGLDIENFISIKNHLLGFGKEKLEQSGTKGSRKKTNNKWFETQDAIGYWNEFAKPKIMYQVFQVKPNFIFDEEGLFCNNSMWIIPTDNKALLGILNSKMGWWLISKYCTQIQNGYQLIWNYFSQIPIPELSNSNLTILVENIISSNSELQESSQKFQRTLQRKFELEILPKKLQDWYLLSYKDFIKELGKKKVKLSLSQEAEWEDYFLQESKKAMALKTNIDATDKEIDAMVYELYGLSEEEVKIVENA